MESMDLMKPNCSGTGTVKKRKNPPSLSLSQSSQLVQLDYSYFGHKGRRQYMEDHLILMDQNQCDILFPELKNHDVRVAMYGILDGHGGSNVGSFVKDKFPYLIVKCLLESGLESPNNAKISASLSTAFSSMEIMIRDKCNKESWTDGCCCVLALFVNNLMHIANLGDSKAVLCRRLKPGQNASSLVPHTDVSGSNGNKTSIHSHKFPWDRSEKPPPPAAEALSLTIDHKPSHITEKERIEKTGAKVENGRVIAGNSSLSVTLAVSRSFGDEAFKRFGVIAEPDLRVRMSISATPSSLLSNKNKIKRNDNNISSDDNKSASHEKTQPLAMSTSMSMSTSTSSIAPTSSSPISLPEGNVSCVDSSVNDTEKVQNDNNDNISTHHNNSTSISSTTTTISSPQDAISTECELLVLGCDGLWERYSERAVLGFVRQRLYGGVSWKDGKECRWTLANITKSLVEDAVFEKGCQDNVSVIVIQFIHPLNVLPNPPEIYATKFKAISDKNCVFYGVSPNITTTVIYNY
eukprot:gene7911-16196_t